jgi:hypothetical protein
MSLPPPSLPPVAAAVTAAVVAALPVGLRGLPAGLRARLDAGGDWPLERCGVMLACWMGGEVG